MNEIKCNSALEQMFRLNAGSFSGHEMTDKTEYRENKRDMNKRPGNVECKAEYPGNDQYESDD